MSLYTRNDQGEVVDAISGQRVFPDEEMLVLAALATTTSPKPPRSANPDEAVIEFWGS